MDGEVRTSAFMPDAASDADAQALSPFPLNFRDKPRMAGAAGMGIGVGLAGELQMVVDQANLRTELQVAVPIAAITTNHDNGNEAPFSAGMAAGNGIS
jgi:hypothetical protein